MRRQALLALKDAEPPRHPGRAASTVGAGVGAQQIPGAVLHQRDRIMSAGNGVAARRRHARATSLTGQTPQAPMAGPGEHSSVEDDPRSGVRHVVPSTCLASCGWVFPAPSECFSHFRLLRPPFRLSLPSLGALMHIIAGRMAPGASLRVERLRGVPRGLQDPEDLKNRSQVAPCLHPPPRIPVVSTEAPMLVWWCVRRRGVCAQVLKKSMGLGWTSSYAGACVGGVDAGIQLVPPSKDSLVWPLIRHSSDARRVGPCLVHGARMQHRNISIGGRSPERPPSGA